MKPSDKNDLIAYFSEPIGKLQDQFAEMEHTVAEQRLHIEILAGRIATLETVILNWFKSMHKEEVDEQPSDSETTA